MGNSSEKTQKGKVQRTQAEKLVLQLRSRSIVIHYAYKMRLVIGDIGIFPHGLSGLKLWESNIVLARYAVLNNQIFKGKTVLQLGSGTGVGGISIIKWTKCKNVTMSDYRQQVVANLHKNCTKNQIKDPTVFRFSLNQFKQFKIKYDIVICSDILKIGYPNILLYDLFCHFTNDTGRVIVIMPDNKELIQKFSEVINSQQFEFKYEKLVMEDYYASPLLNKVEGFQQFQKLQKNQFYVMTLLRKPQVSKQDTLKTLKNDNQKKQQIEQKPSQKIVQVQAPKSKQPIVIIENKKIHQQKIQQIKVNLQQKIQQSKSTKEEVKPQKSDAIQTKNEDVVQSTKQNVNVSSQKNQIIQQKIEQNIQTNNIVKQQVQQNQGIEENSQIENSQQKNAEVVEVNVETAVKQEEVSHSSKEQIIQKEQLSNSNQQSCQKQKHSQIKNLIKGEQVAQQQNPAEEIETHLHQQQKPIQIKIINNPNENLKEEVIHSQSQSKSQNQNVVILNKLQDQDNTNQNKEADNHNQNNQVQNVTEITVAPVTQKQQCVQDQESYQNENNEKDVQNLSQNDKNEQKNLGQEVRKQEFKKSQQVQEQLVIVNQQIKESVQIEQISNAKIETIQVPQQSVQKKQQNIIQAQKEMKESLSNSQQITQISQQQKQKKEDIKIEQKTQQVAQVQVQVEKQEQGEKQGQVQKDDGQKKSKKKKNKKKK